MSNITLIEAPSELEEWKPIEGYEDYMVSNMGRIRSIAKNRRFKSERILKPARYSNGYLFVILCRNKDDHKSHMIHRLVAKAFLENPDNKQEVNHINGNKQDNRADNLEWCTASENKIHAYRTGLRRFSNKQLQRIIERASPVEQIDLETGAVIARYESASAAERAVGGYHSDILKCCKGRASQHKGYKWRYADAG